jgi:hypothetical protein
LLEKLQVKRDLKYYGLKEGDIEKAAEAVLLVHRPKPFVSIL